MSNLNLILTIPYGLVVATQLGVEGFAKHRSPGSAKYFRGKTIQIDLALEGDRPAFRFLDEGGWRDATGDAIAALAAVRQGKRTKTALSNDGFNVAPLSAYKHLFLVKTGAHMLEMDPPVQLLEFVNHACHEELTADQVAGSIGRPAPASRSVRLYMIIEPVQFLVMSNLTPEEYAWYVTHRPGKIFRQVMFTELAAEDDEIVAASRYVEARAELTAKPTKKTKVIALGEFLEDIPFHAWIGYRREAQGGLYVADRNGINLWSFPKVIPRTWDTHNG
jgi:hypothetical protein